MKRDLLRTLVRASALTLAVTALAEGQSLPANSRVVCFSCAAYFGWRGYADLDLKFSEFFNQDHTIMARYMIQYPYAYAGPVLAENGGGTYFVGMGNYVDDPLGVKLTVQIGTARKSITYFDTGKDVSLPISGGTWYHVALVRKGSTIWVYMNGHPQFSIAVPARDLPVPDATVRLGRRTGNKPTDNGTGAGKSPMREGQFYGLVDDVAVFQRALTPEEVRTIANASRLSGSEPGLYAGWSFDDKTVLGLSLPAKLARPVAFHTVTAGVQASGKTAVSTNRSDAYDQTKLPAPVQQTVLNIPFQRGQVWKVARWMDKDTGTHRSNGAFAWDLTLPVNGRTASCGEPILSSAAGEVRAVKNTYDGHIEVEHAPGEYGRYLHIYPGSAAVLVNSPVQMGTMLARVGSQGDSEEDQKSKNFKNCHLHFGVKSIEEGGTGGTAVVTFPVAFSNYDACDAQKGKDCTKSENWYHVPRGVPVAGQWIKNSLLTVSGSGGTEANTGTRP